MNSPTTDAVSTTLDGCPNDLVVEVGLDERVLVVSDLRLSMGPSAASSSTASELADKLKSWNGPGVLIFNGNLIDARPGEELSPIRAFAAHPVLANSLMRFAAEPGHRVIALPGSRDASLAWSSSASAELTERAKATIACSVELRIATGKGTSRVRVEPGQRFDPLSVRNDPRNPGETPLTYHLWAEVMPAIAASGRGPSRWASGMHQLDDPAALPRFVASRLVYKDFWHRSWLLLVPIAVTLILRYPLAFLRVTGKLGGSNRIGLALGVAVLELIAVIALAIGSLRRAWTALAGVTMGEVDRDPNMSARSEARELVKAGWAGLITGHTCRPELTDLGTGFYINAGCETDVISESPTRLSGLGLPSVFLAHRQVDWVEIEAGENLNVTLYHDRRVLPGASMPERLLACGYGTPFKRATISERVQPQVVATFGTGESWPPRAKPVVRRPRRWAALFVALTGFISVATALSAPLRDRLVAVRYLFPLAVPRAAAALTALAGIGLLLLARGILRGQRRAYLICQGFLISVAVLHILKGVNIEGSIVCLAVATFLLANRQSFNAAAQRPTLRRDLPLLAAAAGAAIVAGTLVLETGSWYSTARRHVPGRIPLGRAFQATVERMVGITHVPLPERLDDFFTPAMVGVTIALVLGLARLLFRPVVMQRHHSHADPLLPRAREVLAQHGSGTLDYFALRSDKRFWFWGETVVAHAVYGGVCVVSPDPIGPPAERQEAWRSFREHSDAQGWILAVLGAGQEWLPIYRATGMHDLYVGDEAVVNVASFSLEGGRFKGLRQAVNRIARYGYTITFHDPATIETELKAQLSEVMTKSRRGDVERGFSMTLGRVFDPEDTGLLLAVVHGPGEEGRHGPVVAFCQYVPAPGIGGFSLDLMRRDDGEHPNGLIDFTVVETISYLRTKGYQGLGLNFAMMRAVLAGEAGSGLWQRTQAWMLRRMGNSMQIESLWKFNSKFDPLWQPRYAVYDAPEHAIPAAIAVARAESIWELPLIGRFFVPDAANV